MVRVCEGGEVVEDARTFVRLGNVLGFDTFMNQGITFLRKVSVMTPVDPFDSFDFFDGMEGRHRGRSMTNWPVGALYNCTLPDHLERV